MSPNASSLMPSHAVLSAGRTGLLLAQKNSRRKGEGMDKTLIVGAGRVGSLVWDRLTEHPELGLAPIGFLDKDPIVGPHDGDDGRPLLGASWDLERVVLHCPPSRIRRDQTTRLSVLVPEREHPPK